MKLSQNHLSIDRYARACAARADLHVAWKDGESPHTDGKTLFLPAITSTTTEKQITHIQHFVAHETGHVLHTDFDLPKAVGISPATSFLGMIWNGLEDVRIEYLNSLDFEGDRLNSDKFYSWLLPEMFAKFEKQLKETNNPELGKVMSFMLWMFQQEVEFYPSLSLIELSSSAHPLIAPYYDTLMKGSYSSVLRNIRSIRAISGTNETFSLAKQIFEEVYGEDAEEEKKKQQQQQQGKEDKGGNAGKEKSEASQEAKSTKGESDKEGKASGNGGEPSEGKAEGEATSGESAGEGDADGESDGEFRQIKIIDYSQFQESTTNTSGSGLHIDYSEYKSTKGTYVPTPANEVAIVDFTKETFTEEGENFVRGVNSLSSNNSKAFANKLRTKLQIMAKAKHQYGTKKGHIHNANLYRVTLKNAKGYNERVFKQRIESDTLETCVSVLVDTSGSMNGEGKYEHAIKAAMLLNESIGNVLGIPVAITGFTTDIRGTKEVNKMLIYRKFNNSRMPTDTLLKNMATGGGMGMSNNADGEALVYAYDQLMQQPQKRKVLIVLSDGSPAASHLKGDICAFTKEIIEEIESTKQVDLYAIGIMDDNVKHLYKKHVVITHANELETTLLSVLDKSICS